MEVIQQEIVETKKNEHVNALIEVILLCKEFVLLVELKASLAEGLKKV